MNCLLCEYTQNNNVIICLPTVALQLTSCTRHKPPSAERQPTLSPLQTDSFSLPASVCLDAPAGFSISVTDEL